MQNYNPNAWISIALVSENKGNPYSVFCEYIKYCMASSTSGRMLLSEIRENLRENFGLQLPYNVLTSCMNWLEEEQFVSVERHQFRWTGEYDTEEFDRRRVSYQKTEESLVRALIGYMARRDRDWSPEYAKEQLFRVLDYNGLASDLFLNGSMKENGIPSVQAEEAVAEGEKELEEQHEIEQDPAVTESNTDEPYFPDRYFVGKFIEEILQGNSAEKQYLQAIVEGMMICEGVYQLPSSGAQSVSWQIEGTEFFFDTRLLLRVLGCAGEAAVEAAQELVKIIQDAGGKICYYPQTFQEMERALNDAANRLKAGLPIYDNEMRLYAHRVKNNFTVVRVKQTGLEAELSSKKIYKREHENFTERDRIRYGFDGKDLLQYMQNNLEWDARVIENDARSIWETHMRRAGDFSEYFGTRLRLPVFVTTNPRLIQMALSYRAERPQTKAIEGWRPNRIPVITDIRLTCRLWSPETQGDRLSLLYLMSNVVAAQRPTYRYLNKVRDVALILKEENADYSAIPLSAFFEDSITSAMAEKTLGVPEKLNNIGNFASSLAELTEMKARGQEKRTEQAIRKKII